MRTRKKVRESRMKTRLQTEGIQTYFVVFELDATETQALQELEFAPYSDGFAKAYPSATPHLELFYRHFARSIEEIVLQRAGTRPVPWDQALEALLQRLTRYDHDLQWWLIGSGALAARGLDIIPGDLDLVVDDAGAMKLGEILDDVLLGPVEDARGWISNWFGRAFLHSRIEWAGGIREDVDAHGATEFGSTAARHLETIIWRGYPLQIPPIEIQLDVNKRRGLEKRVRMIEQARSGHARE